MACLYVAARRHSYETAVGDVSHGVEQRDAQATSQME